MASDIENAGPAAIAGLIGKSTANLGALGKKKKKTVKEKEAEKPVRGSEEKPKKEKVEKEPKGPKSQKEPKGPKPGRGPINVDSNRVQKVKSERVFRSVEGPNRKPIQGQGKRKAIEAPKGGGPFVANRSVNLEEGPEFGKPIYEITRLPRQFNG